MDTQRLSGKSAVSKAEYAYQEIREAIISGNLAPGAVLYIRELSDQLNVSRTPVKEAINRLAYDGLVDIYPDRYALVSKIDFADVIDLLEYRKYLEKGIAYFAAQRRTNEDLVSIMEFQQKNAAIAFSDTEDRFTTDRAFHHAIAKASYNRQMVQALRNVFDQLRRVDYLNQKDPARFEITQGQHNSILEAISNGDPDAAEKAMSEHISDIVRTLKDYQYRNIHLFK